MKKIWKTAALLVIFLALAGNLKAVQAQEMQEKTLFTEEDIRYFSRTVDGQKNLELCYKPRKDRQSFLYWDMTVPYESGCLVNTESMYEIFRITASLDSGVRMYACPEETGIKETETFIEIIYGEDEIPLTLLIGKQTDEICYCAWQGKEDETFGVNPALIDRLLKTKPYDLILKIPYVVDIQYISRVEIRRGEEKHCLMGETYTLDDRKLSKEEFQKLYGMLMEPMISREIPENISRDEERELLLEILYQPVEKEGEEYRVQYYAYDDENDIINVNGTEHFLIGNEEVKTLIEKFF